MIFKLAEAAEKSWRRLDGHNQLPKSCEKQSSLWLASAASSFVAFDHHGKRLCTLCDFAWLKRRRTERAVGISDAFRVKKVRHHISFDCEITFCAMSLVWMRHDTGFRLRAS